MDDSNILSGILNGDEETYIFLFREYYISLCSYSRRYVGRKDIAEEIVSEVFMKMWENRKTIKINSSVKSYLFQAVCNNSLNYLRKFKKEESLDQYLKNTSSENNDFSLSVDEISSQKLIFEELEQKINKAIESLPSQQQKAFRYKRFDGKKNKEIAEIMGLSIKTVEMHLSKAMASLKENLKDYLPTFLLFMLLK